MINLSIIGTSNIIIQHLKVLKKTKFNLIAIYSTRKDEAKTRNIARRYNIKKYFINFETFLEYSKNKKSNFLIAPRIQDNKKILNKILKKKINTKIFLEKPVFTKEKEFNNYKRYYKQLFVGYNRCFYKNVNFVKNLKLKNSIIDIKITETSISRIKSNSCHLVSIVLYIFSDLKFIRKFENKKFIICTFKDKKNNFINFNIYFNVLTNFSINIYQTDKQKIVFSPIEKMNLYNKLIKKNNSFKLNIKKTINEDNQFKPGFLSQIKSFENFCENKKIFNNIFFAKKVMKVCEEIIE